METTVLSYFIKHKWLSVICVLLLMHGVALSQASAPVKFGNSYVNLTKKTAGGSVEPGDTLEIRASIYINGTYRGAGMVYNLRYYDNLPTKTDTINDFLRLITNEGVTYRAYGMSLADSDAACFRRVPAIAGDYQYRINIGGPAPAGVPATAPGGIDPMGLGNIVGAGTVKANSTHPLFGGGTLFCTSFRVRVTGAYGDTIVLGAGKIAFRTSAAAITDTVISMIQYKILISKPTTLCSSLTGTNFAAENGGTFGHGTTLNRAAPPTYLIPSYTYLPNSGTAVTINDGYYAIVNNISPTSSTFAGARETPNCNVPSAIPNTDPNSCFNREFGGYWYISGDHTGSGTAAGNPPPAVGTDAGYMLLVNADIATSEAYRQTISGLCPNTYYTFSASIKNVCPTCGIDTAGHATYTPGVLPNLTFVVDSIDRYSSGQLDTLGWQQRGFVLLTGPAQTSITISLRDNAPGGGGNDWALDDIALASCPPQLSLTPNRPDTLCQGADDTVRFKVAAYVNNYTQYKLEKSIDGGTTWISVGVDTAGNPASGSMVPVFDPATSQYIDTVSRYFRLSTSDHLIKYRITVASTVANLASAGCAYAATSLKLVLAVNCNIILPVTLISFRGQSNNDLANLQWVSATETANTSFVVERSTDGVHFAPAGTLGGIAGAGQGASYQFTDPTPLTGPTYYRINTTDGNYHRYSQQILLSNTEIGFAVKSLSNPFVDNIGLQITVPGNGTALVTLVDMYGRLIRQVRQPMSQGLNAVNIGGLGGLSNGAYALQVRFGDKVVSTKMLKLGAL
jgi:hypothetical protein